MSLEYSPGRDNDLDSIRVIPDIDMPQILGVSLATWERCKRLGDRPQVTQISKRRIGYRMIDIRAWLDSKRRNPEGRVIRAR